MTHITKEELLDKFATEAMKALIATENTTLGVPQGLLTK